MTHDMTNTLIVEHIMMEAYVKHRKPVLQILVCPSTDTANLTWPLNCLHVELFQPFIKLQCSASAPHAHGHGATEILISCHIFSSLTPFEIPYYAVGA